MSKKIITIGRTYGSGGRLIGREVANKLGYAFYDKELIELAAKECGFSPDFIKANEQRSAFGFFANLASQGFSYSKDTLPPADMLFVAQCKVIQDIAAKEDCVIVGRCADYILKDRDDVVRLFFYAPMEDCISRAKEVSGEEEKDLVKKINRINKYRADYYRYYTGHEWNDSEYYDFCLNTSSMSYEKLVEVVKAYLEIYNA